MKNSRPDSQKRLFDRSIHDGCWLAVRRRTHRALASTRVHLFPREGPHGPRCASVRPSRGVARLSLHKIQNLFRSIHRRSLVYTTSKVTRGMGYERCSRVRAAPLAWNLLRRDIFFLSEFFLFYEILFGECFFLFSRLFVDFWKGRGKFEGKWLIGIFNHESVLLLSEGIFSKVKFISKNIFHHRRTFNLKYLNFENSFSFSPPHLFFKNHALYHFLNLPSLYRSFRSQRSLYINFDQFFSPFYPPLYQFPYLKLLTPLSQRIISNIIKTFPSRIASQLLKFSSLNTISPFQP